MVKWDGTSIAAAPHEIYDPCNSMRPEFGIRSQSRKHRTQREAHMRPQRRLVRLAQVLLAQALALATVAIAPPARAQGTPPAGPSGSAAGGAAVPNLSGMWAHPYLTGFEPPVSGPGPILNRSRRPNGVANFQLLVGDYTNPILKPEAAAIVKKHGEISLSGGGYPTPSNQCWPQGVPYVFWDFIVQLIQEPHQVTLIYRHGNEVRHVRMNAQHPAQVTPSWYGELGRAL